MSESSFFWWNAHLHMAIGSLFQNWNNILMQERIFGKFMKGFTSNHSLKMNWCFENLFWRHFVDRTLTFSVEIIIIIIGRVALLGHRLPYNILPALTIPS
jgi:hypothetical protein